jgi:hypothetical protein
LKKNLFATLVGSNGASGSCSDNSKCLFLYKHSFFFLIKKYFIYQYVRNVAILQEQDKQYDEEHYLDRIQMKHPESKRLMILLINKKKE